MSVDVPRAEAAIRELLIAIGEDPERDGLRDTPRRVAKAYSELLAGMDQDPRDVLDALVEQLLEKETLDKSEVAEIFEPLRRRQIRPAWTGSDTRVPSTVPPVEGSSNGRQPANGVVIGPDSGPDAPPPGAPDDDLAPGTVPPERP